MCNNNYNIFFTNMYFLFEKTVHLNKFLINKFLQITAVSMYALKNI